MFTKEVIPEGGSWLDRPSLHDHVATRARPESWMLCFAKWVSLTFSSSQGIILGRVKTGKMGE
jgi:hypothetical protein